jgi:hypothetical protein
LYISSDVTGRTVAGSTVVAEETLVLPVLSMLLALPDFDDPTDEVLDGPSGLGCTGTTGVASTPSIAPGRTVESAGFSVTVATLPSSAYILVPPILVL